MIPQEELRKGNYVSLHARYVKVISLRLDKLEVESLSSDVPSPRWLVGYDSITPIPITTSLLKYTVGMEYNESIHIANDTRVGMTRFGFYPILEKDGTGAGHWWIVARFKHIKSMHQLQNWVYWNTGSELAFNKCLTEIQKFY